MCFDIATRYWGEPLLKSPAPGNSQYEEMQIKCYHWAFSVEQCSKVTVTTPPPTPTSKWAQFFNSKPKPKEMIRTLRGVIVCENIQYKCEYERRELCPTCAQYLKDNDFGVNELIRRNEDNKPTPPPEIYRNYKSSRSATAPQQQAAASEFSPQPARGRSKTVQADPYRNEKASKTKRSWFGRKRRPEATTPSPPPPPPSRARAQTTETTRRPAVRRMNAFVERPNTSYSPRPPSPESWWG